jgi:4-hydroxy-4-methyl-2-oxoglutarate aldolase
MLAPISSRAQIFVFSKDELTALTAKNPFERFPDGRPRILDSMLERARSLSM